MAANCKPPIVPPPTLTLFRALTTSHMLNSMEHAAKLMTHLVILCDNHLKRLGKNGLPDNEMTNPKVFMTRKIRYCDYGFIGKIFSDDRITPFTVFRFLS